MVVLHLYEEVSGQTINFDIFGLFFDLLSGKSLYIRLVFQSAEVWSSTTILKISYCTDQYTSLIRLRAIKRYSYRKYHLGGCTSHVVCTKYR